MTVGSDAAAAGYPLVPNEGEDGKVKYGAREINRTRDFVAQTNSLVPKTKSESQTRAGIRYGTAAPTGGADGDIYFQIY